MDVDFHYIPDAQAAIHERLLNWAKWVNGSGHPASSPMFAAYRSTEVWAAPEASQPVDTIDAQRVERAVCSLGLTERVAIRWHYVKPVGSHRVARDLGITKAGLAQAVIDARETLRSRLTETRNGISSPERESQRA